MRVLIVDDEPLARVRLRALLHDCGETPVGEIAEAASATEAWRKAREGCYELVLLDVQMPGASGLDLAAQLRTLHPAPALVFVTAHARHAVEAFDVEATDFLTKPVRVERLQAALRRVVARRAERALQPAQDAGLQADDADGFVPVLLRGHLLRVPLAEVLYFKAELKYLTLRTATHAYVLEGALSDWEARLAGRFLRIHRNALVCVAAVRELRRGTEGTSDADAADGWAVRIAPVQEWLAVSRRQLPAVRAVLGQAG